MILDSGTTLDSLGKHHQPHHTSLGRKERKVSACVCLSGKEVQVPYRAPVSCSGHTPSSHVPPLCAAQGPPQISSEGSRRMLVLLPQQITGFFKEPSYKDSKPKLSLRQIKKLSPVKTRNIKCEGPQVPSRWDSLKNRLHKVEPAGTPAVGLKRKDLCRQTSVASGNGLVTKLKTTTPPQTNKQTNNPVWFELHFVPQTYFKHVLMPQYIF